MESIIIISFFFLKSVLVLSTKQQRIRRTKRAARPTRRTAKWRSRRRRSRKVKKRRTMTTTTTPMKMMKERQNKRNERNVITVRTKVPVRETGRKRSQRNNPRRPNQTATRIRVENLVKALKNTVRNRIRDSSSGVYRWMLRSTGNFRVLCLDNSGKLQRCCGCKKSYVTVKFATNLCSLFFLSWTNIWYIFGT